MLSSVISKIFGNKSDKDIKRLQPQLIEINNIYKTLSSLSDEQIIEKYNIEIEKESCDDICVLSGIIANFSIM